MKFLFHFGRYVNMIFALFKKPERFRMYWKEYARQMNNIGVGSLIIVAFISVFVGAVTAIQFAYQIQGSAIPMWWVGFVVRDTMILELAPTISCLLLAGKVGSNISSELGSMRVNEQIDALQIMGVNVRSYLVGPKILAAVTVIPMLVIIAAFLGVYGGLIAGKLGGYVSATEYQLGVLDEFNPHYIKLMYIKAVVFAFTLTSVAAYQGFYVKGGAIEIGEASTRAVVFSSILILAFDYLIAAALL